MVFIGLCAIFFFMFLIFEIRRILKWWMFSFIFELYIYVLSFKIINGIYFIVGSIIDVIY